MHPFFGTPQYDQQYGARSTGTPGNGLGIVTARDPQIDASGDDDTDDGLPHGWGVYAARQIGVTDRPHDIVENEAEIALAFGEHAQPTVTCGYCCDRVQTRSLARALRWWQDHACGAAVVDPVELLAA